VEREGREEGEEKEVRVREWRVKTVLPHVKQAVAAYGIFFFFLLLLLVRNYLTRIYLYRM